MSLYDMSLEATKEVIMRGQLIKLPELEDFDAWIKVQEEKVSAEDPKKLAEMFAGQDDYRLQTYSQRVDASIKGIYQEDREKHWKLGYLFFYLDACELFRALGYRSFSAYIEGEREIDASVPWAHKIKNVYEIFMFRFRCYERYEDMEILNRITNFDMLNMILPIVTGQNYRTWIAEAARLSEREGGMDDLRTQVDLAKEALTKGENINTVAPQVIIPPRRYRIAFWDKEGKHPIRAKDLPSEIRGDIPAEAQVEVIVKVRKF